MVMGTLPLKAEELDDKTLLELDPIGTIADAFAQVQEHLHVTNEELKHAHDEIQAILSAAGEGILVVDDKMRIQAYNQRLKELFLPPDHEMKGEYCFRVLCKQPEPPATCMCRKVMATKVGMYQADWIDNDRQGFVFIIKDITRRRETELQLSFLGAVQGVTTSVNLTSEVACHTCHGTGAKPGTVAPRAHCAQN